MTIRHLQLNSSLLRAPEQVAKFIVDEKVDLACVQEILYPINGSSPLKSTIEKVGYNYEEGVNFIDMNRGIITAEAIISRWTIIDCVRLYYNGVYYEPKTLTKSNVIGEGLVIGDTERADIDRPGSRGVRHSVKSRCFISALVETENQKIRLATTHFNVSDQCTETIQMYEMACMIRSFFVHAKELPIIFSGDLNVRPHAYSIAKLSEVLTCHTGKFTDTLAKDHSAKKISFPEGLAIDHVFSKKLNLKNIDMKEVDFSDHKAILSEFES